NGGAIQAVNTGQVVTWGANASAVFAQSVGGGGGLGGFSVAGAASQANGASNSIGGAGGVAGQGGDITLANQGAAAKIQTAGDYAYGVFAQSVG
ncbi:hypothetical protein C1X44_34020, partial [Pseudomonas sp. MPR-AND1A]